MGIFIGIALAAAQAAAAAAAAASSVMVGTAGVAGSAGLFGSAGAFTGTGLLTGAATVGSSVMGIMSGQAAQAQGKQQQKMMEYNALVENRNAEAARMKSLFEVQRKSREAYRARGSLTAGLAAAGGLGSEVADDLTVEQAKEYELEGMLIAYEGETQALRHESQAYNDIMAGKAAAKSGRSAAMGSYIGAGAGLLTGFASSYKKGTTNTMTRPDLGFSYG